VLSLLCFVTSIQTDFKCQQTASSSRLVHVSSVTRVHVDICSRVGESPMYIRKTTVDFGMHIQSAMWAGIAQSVQRLTMCWAVGEGIPVGGEIFHTCMDRNCGRPNECPIQWVQVLSRGKVDGAWRDQPHPCNAEIKERVELYIYSPSAFVTCPRVHSTLLKQSIYAYIVRVVND
jgi:hypothetical protein